jgi:hypothetical protein
LRLRARQAKSATLVGIQDGAPGLRLESLELSSDGESTTHGIELVGDAGTEREPIVIQGCTFRGLGLAVGLVGAGPDRVANVALRDSQFIDCLIGARISGRAVRTQIVGNRFSGAVLAATQLQMLSPDSEDIVLANNSFTHCAAAFRLWDSKVKAKGVRFQNNLLLDGQNPDIYSLEADNADTSKGPGDGAAMAKTYDFGHNWREGHAPTGGNAKAWAAPDPKKGDVFREKIDGVNTDPKSPDFLRPDPKALLATQGAGVTDPSLPRYVGALPPKGTPAWDWDRAWLAPPRGKLITVSKDANDKADFDTLGKALAAVTKPWTTIRVLDADTYSEALTIADAEKQTGLTLEAMKKATLLVGPRVGDTALSVQDVPQVCVRGFRFREAVPRKDAVIRALVQVKGRAGGFVLEDAELTLSGGVIGVMLRAVEGPDRAGPAVVRRCRFTGLEVANDGIEVVGPRALGPCRNVRVLDNRFDRVRRGVWLSGATSDVLVAGNLLAGCGQGGLQLEDLAVGSRDIAFVNNTAIRCARGFTVFYNGELKDPERHAVELVNNLFLLSEDCDLGSVAQVGPTCEPAGNGAEIVRQWRFRNNRRDYAGSSNNVLLPKSPGVPLLEAGALPSVDRTKPEDIRPKKDSPLATEGAGKNDASLPAYIGALPPEGVAAWDWDRTWRARAPKVVEEKKDAPK